MFFNIDGIALAHPLVFRSDTLLRVLSHRKGRVIRVTKIPTYKSVRFVYYECDQSDSRSSIHTKGAR